MKSLSVKDLKSSYELMLSFYSSWTSGVPVHAVFSQAAGGQPLGVGTVSSLLSHVGVILKLLNDVLHIAGTDCTHRRITRSVIKQHRHTQSAEKADVYETGWNHQTTLNL